MVLPQEPSLVLELFKCDSYDIEKENTFKVVRSEEVSRSHREKEISDFSFEHSVRIVRKRRIALSKMRICSIIFFLKIAQKLVFLILHIFYGRDCIFCLNWVDQLFSSSAISFMDNNALVVAMGRTRRGFEMGILRCVVHINAQAKQGATHTHLCSFFFSWLVTPISNQTLLKRNNEHCNTTFKKARIF